MDIWQVKNIKVKDLLPNKKNPRKISKENLKKLKSKIERLGFHNPVKVDEKMNLLGGNQRVKALLEMGAAELEIPVMIPNRPLTKKEKDEIIITDNISDGEWDWDLLKNEWNMEELNNWGLEWDLPDDKDDFDKDEMFPDGKAGSLKEKYLAAPFSVLDAKKGDWQERKKAWIDLGVDSGEGRAENLLSLSKTTILASAGNGTSIFDPVLCEILYSWFSKEGDAIIDPFSGGSVRGIVASCLNRQYTGIDLRPEQIEANEKQANNICKKNKPKYITGDSAKILPTIKDNSFDFCLSCPPYSDLEVYSDLPDDLSNMPYDKFFEIYSDIIKNIYPKLKDDAFVAWVVGEIRDKNGNMRGFVPETIKAFKDAGFNLYNEMILTTMLGTSMLRTKAFQSSRKVVKVHQNVLIFCKGDAKKITKRLGKVEILKDF